MDNFLLVKSKPERFKHKKAMCATWDETCGSEPEEDSDYEEAVLCFMAFQENDDESEVNNVENENPSYDDSLFHFEEMYGDT